MKLTTVRLLSIIGFLLFLWGCQSDVSLSSAVRVGDTITVSLGNADPNDVGNITPANITKALIKPADITTATIHSDSNTANKHNVTVRYLFRAFADPTGSAPAFRGQAMWIAVVDLANSGGPVPLLPGPATLTFNSQHFKSAHTIKVDILAGQGSSAPFLSKQWTTVLNKFQFIEPGKQAKVQVTGTLPAGRELGAAKYVFDIPNKDDTSNPNQTLTAAAPARFPTKEQINFRVVKGPSIEHGASGTLVTIYLTAADGLDEAQLSRFDFVMTSELPAVNGNVNYWATHYEDSEYYDTTGELIEPAYLDHNVGLIE